MRRKSRSSAVTPGVVLMLALSPLIGAQDKSSAGPLSGIWECMSQGGPQGDTSFKLELAQNGETVTGSVSSAQGGMEITSATFKNETLEIHLDTPDGSYLLTAKLNGGKLTKGETTLDGKAYGTWEGKKGSTADGG